MAHPWPLFDLRLRTPRMELRAATDEDLLALVRVARAGLHDPAEAPFLVPWDELPSPAFERQFLLHWWRSRGSWSPANWTLNLAVVVEGEPVGIQDLMASDFAHRRSVSSGSWLGREYQGRGLGTEMRGAVLWLAFEGLGAAVAESGFLETSRASARVSEKLGYVTNGERILAPKGAPLREQQVRVTPATWRRELVPVTVENLEPCLGLFGVREMAPDEWSPL
jgi:RimJ/RimL family protein N-acetyltransferase